MTPNVVGVVFVALFVDNSFPLVEARLGRATYDHDDTQMHLLNLSTRTTNGSLSSSDTAEDDNAADGVGGRRTVEVSRDMLADFCRPSSCPFDKVSSDCLEDWK